MNVQKFLAAFEEMRSHNLGKQFERRELGLLALQYGIYFNSTMWACGLSSLFRIGKIGPKYVYSFKNTVITPAQIAELSVSIRAYKNNNDRTIEHAKRILRRFGIRNVDLYENPKKESYYNYIRKKDRKYLYSIRRRCFLSSYRY